MQKDTRPKPVLKESDKPTDCYIPGCYMSDKMCQGIPYSNKCASCRCKKNYLKVNFN